MTLYVDLGDIRSGKSTLEPGMTLEKNILSYNVPTNPASRFLIRVPNRLLLLFTAETVAITISTNCLTHYIILTNKCNRWDN